jgi:HEAT repeat protein
VVGEQTKSEAGIDLQPLAQFIHDLNVARRFIVSYPDNHPLLVAAEQRVATLAASLLSTAGTITLGVAKEGLLLGTEPLDRQNPSFLAFARLLYAHAVAAISFSPGVTPDELHVLNALLGRKPEQVRADGGIAALLGADVRQIQIREIDYDVFTATDDLETDVSPDAAEGGLWQQFVQSLLAGVLDRTERNWQGVTLEDVDILTQIVLEQGGTEGVRLMIANYSRALANLSRQLRNTGNQNAKELIDRVGRFIQGLSMDMRQQFLQSTLKALTHEQEITCQLLGSMNPEVVMETLQQLSEQELKLPPLVLGLIGALAKNAGIELPPGLMREQEAANRLRELFREDDLTQFVPEDYRESLQRILSGEEPLLTHAVPPLELAELLVTTSSHVLEAKTSDIILEILKTCPDEEMISTLQRNLLEMCGYFLEIGDFSRLIDLHERLSGESNDTLHELVKTNVLQAFASPSFIQEVFHGLSFWGKAKYPDIQRLITTVGEPFVEPLLERLAEEQNMSLRRFYMDRLLEIGPVIQDHLLARLRDSRWYFVRNLLVLLRANENPLICKPVRRLFNHPHPRVRAEALRTLLHFGDPEADAILVQQLDSSDEETFYTAIQLAEKSANPQVFAKLLSFLDRGSMTNYEFKLKCAVVTSLAEMANPAALPRLEQILLSGSLLHAGSHARLKAEIMRTLDRYPVAAVKVLLTRVIEKGSNELVRQAEEVYRILQRKGHGSATEHQSP